MPYTMSGRKASRVEYFWRFGARRAAVCRESENTRTFRPCKGANRVRRRGTRLLHLNLARHECLEWLVPFGLVVLDRAATVRTSLATHAAGTEFAAIGRSIVTVAGLAVPSERYLSHSLLRVRKRFTRPVTRSYSAGSASSMAAGSRSRSSGSSSVNTSCRAYGSCLRGRPTGSQGSRRHPCRPSRMHFRRCGTSTTRERGPRSRYNALGAGHRAFRRDRCRSAG